MTPKTFKMICRKLYGPEEGWHDRVAADKTLGASIRTVFRWASGETPIRQSVATLLRQRYKELGGKK